MTVLTKFLLTAAPAVISCHSYPKTDDPTRIVSAAESIDRRLRQGNLRRRADESPSVSRDLMGAEQNDRKTSAQAEVEVDVSPDLKIIGGVYSAANRYPYLASLTYAGSIHLCGGSLIAKDIILSAAHCAGYSSHIELGRYDKSIGYVEGAEQIEVAYEIKHPDWDPKTVDNDFMLMKLVSPSEKHPVITLNKNPSFPSIPGEKVTLMGWGDTDEDPDVNQPSLQLLEVELEYIPDDVCRSKQGYVGNPPDLVSYENRITENMMCAMDQDGSRGESPVDEDTCLGDSGGPMIVPVSGQDLQVGIVSWGIGCASPTFPGVYSRISSQYEWIRETVCEHSLSAPEDFECGESGGSNAGLSLFEDDADDSKSYVTLEVSLDEQPHEFSWMVSTLTGQSDKLIATIPPGFYSGFKNYTFHHKLEVNPDQFHRISLRDTFGDGLQGYVAVYRGTVPILSHLIMYERLFHDKDRSDFNRVDHAFYTGLTPPNYFSLAIKFDKFPRDVWWKLESETDGVIIEQRPPGWYNERFELMSIVEYISVFGSRPGGIRYRFTMGDSFPCETNPEETCGDGICCNYGEGEYRLYAGPPNENGHLLSSGGNYGLSQSLVITPPSS